MVNARFVNSVGVAPSTTTMMVPYATPGDMSGLHGLGLIAPGTAIRTGRRGVIPGTTTLQVFDNGARVVNQLPGALFGPELLGEADGGGWWKWPLAVIGGGILGATIAHFATRGK
jgi:hypothetical protein